MVDAALSSQVYGYCLVDLKIEETSYSKVTFLIMKNLCFSLIPLLCNTGHDFLQQHSHVEIPAVEKYNLMLNYDKFFLGKMLLIYSNMLVKVV